jgi:hypothetical protein
VNIFSLVGDCLPPRGVESDKRKRQYEHIKESELKRGASEEDAERIAAATTNKTKKEKGETKSWLSLYFKLYTGCLSGSLWEKFISRGLIVPFRI